MLASDERSVESLLTSVKSDWSGIMLILTLLIKKIIFTVQINVALARCGSMPFQKNLEAQACHHNKKRKYGQCASMQQNDQQGMPIAVRMPLVY
jgi:hypothetical protein